MTSLGAGGWQLTVDTRFPTADFTLTVDRALVRVQVAGADLHPVSSRGALRAGTFWVDGRRTVLAFDLGEGQTTVGLWEDAGVTGV